MKVQETDDEPNVREAKSEPHTEAELSLCKHSLAGARMSASSCEGGRAVSPATGQLELFGRA